MSKFGIFSNPNASCMDNGNTGMGTLDIMELETMLLTRGREAAKLAAQQQAVAALIVEAAQAQGDEIELRAVVGGFETGD